MVFIGGPRQIGKTTLELTAIGAKYKSCSTYLNWDFLQDVEGLKTGEKSLSSAIPYFAARTTIPKFYQVHRGTMERKYPESRAEILPFAKFCRDLKMP